MNPSRNTAPLAVFQTAGGPRFKGLDMKSRQLMPLSLPFFGTFLSTICGLIMSAGLLTALAGCTAKNDTTPAPAAHKTTAPIEPVPEDARDIEAFTQNTSVDCENSSDCPSGIGLVIKKEIKDGKARYEQCTSFLVDNETLITNSHCLPASIRGAGKACNGSILVIFPRTPDSPAERASCSKILVASQISSTQRDNTEYAPQGDYAILRLAHAVHRRPLKLSRQGLPDQESLKAFVIDTHTPGSDSNAVGVLKSKTCTAVQGTLLARGYRHPFAPVVSLSDCEAALGNSGSPLLDSNGDVRAVIQAVLTKANDTSDDEARPATKIPMALATNVACMDLPAHLQGGSLHADCAKPAPSEKDILRAMYAQVNVSILSKAFEEWQAQLIPTFEFEMKRLPVAKGDLGAFVMTPEVRCVRDPRQWKNMVRVIGSEATLNLRAPVWGFRVGFDPRLRYVLKPLIYTHTNLQLVFNLSELEQNGRTFGKATTLTEGSGHIAVQDRYEVKLCGRE